MKYIGSLLLVSLMLGSAHAQVGRTQIEPLLKSHYLFSEFTLGTVVKKSGRRNQALLNYNTISEEIVFDKRGTKLAIPKKDYRLIDTVYIADRRFIVVNEEIVELLTFPRWELYIAHKCRMRRLGNDAGFGGRSETSAVNAYSSINANGAVYELSLPDDYKIDPYTHYWFKKDGKLKKFVSIKSLRKLYKSQSNEFKVYVKEHNVDYDNQESIIELIEYLESN